MHIIEKTDWAGEYDKLRRENERLSMDVAVAETKLSLAQDCFARFYQGHFDLEKDWERLTRELAAKDEERDGLRASIQDLIHENERLRATIQESLASSSTEAKARILVEALKGVKSDDSA